MSERKLVFMDSKSSKFWNIKLDGDSHTVTYGRMGTDGQSKTKSFDDADKAKKDYEKLVNAKLSKGYVDAGGGSAQTSGGGDDLPAIAFHSIHHLDDIHENAKTFIGLRVADYDPEKKPAKGGKTVYRFRSDWEDDHQVEHLQHFLATDEAGEAKGIVIGNWGGEESQGEPDEVIKLLIDNKDRLTSLVAIYLGDITSEENEMSWIQQTDISPLLAAFPNLQLLRTRGADGLKLSKPKHKKLRGLVIESGGLGVHIIKSICKSDFPNMEHLELWLGTEEYGLSASVEDLQPILSGKLFPKLKYLGLRNCQFVDDIAAVIVNSPIIERIESLDLSLGVLTDEGGRAFLSLPDNTTLKHISLHHNYLTPDVSKQLKKLPVKFDLSNPSHMDQDEEWRFVAVGE